VAIPFLTAMVIDSLAIILPNVQNY